LTCVDNFWDWRGQPPAELKDVTEINFIHSNEYNFIMNCKEKYDFIVSDADHENTDKWVANTIDLLNTNGILIYHDVTNKGYPNLYSIVEYVRNNNIQHMLFDQNSLPNERCDRGLLVIKKV
jgi:predicted O-methyltransferase YrrM